jgi:D-alanyl-lipoteichoic acid acyltransferase DltB (MBOAT superfamily)
LPQVQKPRLFNYTQAVEGCRLILWGLFKKVVIADSLASIVDPIFQNYLDYNGVTLIIAAIAFSFQIYGDFSGYSDIALGTAKLFGFELLSNFKFPYFSRELATLDDADPATMGITRDREWIRISPPVGKKILYNSSTGQSFREN